MGLQGAAPVAAGHSLWPLLVPEDRSHEHPPASPPASQLGRLSAGPPGDRCQIEQTFTLRDGRPSLVRRARSSGKNQIPLAFDYAIIARSERPPASGRASGWADAGICMQWGRFCSGLWGASKRAGPKPAPREMNRLCMALGTAACPRPPACAFSLGQLLATKQNMKRRALGARNGLRVFIFYTSFDRPPTRSLEIENEWQASWRQMRGLFHSPTRLRARPRARPLDGWQI